MRRRDRMEKGMEIGICVMIVFMLICVIVPTNAIADYCVISDEKIDAWDTDSDGYNDSCELSFKISNTNEANDTDVHIDGYIYSPDGGVSRLFAERGYTITNGDSQVFKTPYNLGIHYSQGSYKIKAEVIWKSTSSFDNSSGIDYASKNVSLYPPGYGDSENDTTDDDTTDGEKEESSDSPGFEPLSAVIVIGLCIGILGWRRRKN